ncbi:MAG: enoyl-CoA hydratase/isomerase family protein [Tetrasphaera sp.]|nr:enoyl-CoA hydratase/isomerase family protein [Tetrasphaera sp.]
MGGGLGLSAHAAHRWATPDTRFAMPETGIGFFPDAGSSLLLARAPGETGTYLALTGATIDATSGRYADLTDHLLAPAALAAALAALEGGCDPAEALVVARTQIGRPGPVPDDASLRPDDEGSSRLEADRTWIDPCFAPTAAAAAPAATADAPATAGAAPAATAPAASSAAAPAADEEAAVGPAEEAVGLLHRLVTRRTRGPGSAPLFCVAVPRCPSPWLLPGCGPPEPSPTSWRPWRPTAESRAMMRDGTSVEGCGRGWWTRTRRGGGIQTRRPSPPQR